MATIPLVNLLDALLQKSYHDLNVLQELLRNKSDGDRKVEIVKYAQRTRALLIRLLALVKWAGNSSSVQKCSEMSAMLSQQSGLYVNTADQLVELVRTTLVNACAPNFSLAPALDVLSTGTYPRLPTCIKDKIIPMPPLTSDQQTQAFSLITCAIRRRLLRETIPSNMTVASIGDGVICFKVPYEFELSLSVLSDNPAVPWRLISLKILVSEALPDKPVLLHHHQKLYLHQLVQSRLYSEEHALRDCYECLHSFCLALQLDCLHSQANQLSAEVFGGYMKVEEYTHAHHLKIVYWRPGTSHFMSAFLLDQSRTLLWPKILISIDSSQTTNPFSTQHFPPLPNNSQVKVVTSSLSLGAILKQCIQVRSHALLSEIRETLRDSVWDERAELQEVPLCLRVRVPLKYSSKSVVLGVDPRVGNVVASVDPPCTVSTVSVGLQELEKEVTSSYDSLETHLNQLQCHLFIAHMSELANSLNLPVHWSLPLVNPLPFHCQSLLYLELRPLTHLVVSVIEGLLDQYHLLTLSPTSLSSPSTLQSVDGSSPPKIFFTVSSLLELDPEEITLQHLKTVKVKRSGAPLKRKMKESNLVLPSLKRLCLRNEPDFAPLPSLVLSRMVLLSMETSLTAARISHHTSYTQHGFPTAKIFSFPRGYEGSTPMHQRLSSYLQSCTVTHSNSAYCCTIVFSPLDLGGQAGVKGNVVLRQTVPVPDQRKGGADLGQTLVGQWEARVSLLALTLELHQYLGDCNWSLQSLCSISEFTYDKLTIAFSGHQLHITATPTGLSLGFSPDCPHLLIRDSLEAFLRATRSLSLLLQGVCVTSDLMASLSEFVKRIPAVTVSATSPSLLQLSYNHSFSLSMSLQADSSVVFTDMRYLKPMGVPLQINPLSYLQAFLHSAFSSSSDAEDTSEKPPSSVTTSTPQKPSLYPTPSPISFPRRTSWPESVPSPRGGFNLPSIPPFPSPAMGAAHSQGSSWSCRLSLEQLNQLLSTVPPQPVKPDSCVLGCSLLESFLGSISLLFHALQQVTKHQMGFVQCDRGVYTYRTENMAVVIAMEGAVLRVTLKPVRENVWSPSEIENLMELFKKEVVTPTFSHFDIQSFLSLVNLPLPLLKSCVQLINHQQKPPSGLPWTISLCLTIPTGADTAGTPFFKGGAAVVYGRGKLLLFLRMERAQDKKSFVLPLMFDPKTNLTYIARFQNQSRSPLLTITDTILKKASADFVQAQIPGHQSLSLFPAVYSLAQTTTLSV